MIENLLVSGDAADFLSRIPPSAAKVVYLDPPHDRQELVGSLNQDANAYLEYLAQLFFHCHSILRADGFLAINVPHHYRVEIQAMLEHIFGKQNFATEIVVPSRKNSPFGLSSWHTSILILKKSEAAQFANLFRPLHESERTRYNQKDDYGSFTFESLYRVGHRPTLSYEYEGYTPPQGRHWRYSREKLQNLDDEGKIAFDKGNLKLKRYLGEDEKRKFGNVWDDINQVAIGLERTGHPTQQSEALLDRLLNLVATENDLIVDPFCGSGTSMISALKFGMKWYGNDVDTSTILLAEERLRFFKPSVEVVTQSMEQFCEQNQQHRPTKKNVDVSLRTYLQKPVAPTKLHKNVFRKRFAFVIGIEEYMDREKNSLSKVDYARNDALAFKEILLSKLGMAEEDIALFIDNRADRNTIKYDLIQALAMLTDEDQFIFYYAGHGFQLDSKNYLTTYDTHPSGITDTSLSLQDDILIRLHECRCKSGMFFIDACATETRSGSARSFLPSFDGQEFHVTENENEYLATFLSCGRGQSSYPSARLKHGIWTYHLIEALSGRAATALRAGRFVTDHSLMRHLTTAVPQSIKRDYGIKVHQTPRSHVLSSEETIILETEMSAH